MIEAPVTTHFSTALSIFFLIEVGIIQKHKLATI